MNRSALSGTFKPYVIFLIFGIAVGTIVGMGFGLPLSACFLAAIYFIFSLFRPRYALYLFILSYPLFSTFSLSLGNKIPDINFNRAMVSIIVISFFLCAYFKKIKFNKINNIDVLMIIFSLFTIISMAFNYNSYQLIQNSLTFMDCFVIPFLIYFFIKNIINNNKDFIKFTIILIIPAIYLSIMGIYEHFSLNDLFPVEVSSDVFDYEYNQGLRVSESGISRVNGSLEFPESFGLILAMIMLIISYHFGPIYNSQKGKLLKNWKLILILSLLGFALYCNMYRSVWLGTIAGFIIRFGLFQRQRFKLLFSIIFIAIVVWAYAEKMKSTSVYTERITNVKTLHARIATYKSALAILTYNPGLGVGFNNFSDIYTKFNYSRTFRGAESRPWVHNSFLKICVESGIIGFILFVLILKSFFLYMLRLLRDKEGILLSAICLSVFVFYIINVSFTTMGHDPSVNILFYALMGTLIGRVN